MSKKLGEIPAWGGFLITIAGLLLAAGVSWGTSNYRLNAHDAELGKIQIEMTETRAVLKRMGENIATLLERTRP